jgi:hypothetical protein
VAARAHQTLIWERTRHTLRLRSALREFFPAALVACAGLGLTGADTLELLERAPGPAAAAKLTVTQISAALKRAGRRDVAPALRQLSNRLVGILHGCLKTRTHYDEATAWPNAVAHTEPLAA